MTDFNILIIAFFIIATVYSMVGFGGGSSYVALLALFALPYKAIPQIALICNIIVVTVGVIHFYRQGHLKLSLLLPFALTSIPMAYLGGLIPVKKEYFYILLGISLLAAGARLLFLHKTQDYENVNTPNRNISAVIGALLGFLSGMVGIGGGIFLAPIMLNLKWGKPKEVAAIASAFILLNSLSGLTGQIVKHHGFFDMFNYWPLFIAVFFGGQLGSSLGAGQKVSHSWVRACTAALIIYVGVGLLLKNWPT